MLAESLLNDKTPKLTDQHHLLLAELEDIDDANQDFFASFKRRVTPEILYTTAGMPNFNFISNDEHREDLYRENILNVTSSLADVSTHHFPHLFNHFRNQLQQEHHIRAHFNLTHSEYTTPETITLNDGERALIQVSTKHKPENDKRSINLDEAVAELNRVFPDKSYKKSENNWLSKHIKVSSEPSTRYYWQDEIDKLYMLHLVRAFASNQFFENPIQLIFTLMLKDTGIFNQLPLTNNSVLNWNSDMLKHLSDTQSPFIQTLHNRNYTYENNQISVEFQSSTTEHDNRMFQICDYEDRIPTRLTNLDSSNGDHDHKHIVFSQKPTQADKNKNILTADITGHNGLDEAIARYPKNLNSALKINSIAEDPIGIITTKTPSIWSQLRYDTQQEEPKEHHQIKCI